MRDALVAAEARLDQAQQDLTDGRAALEAQRGKVTDTVTDIYEQGDPELLAFASLLNSETPADLTRRMEARNVIVGNETRAYDDLHAAEVLLEVREAQVEDARDAVEVQRQAAADHLVTTEQLFQETKTRARSGAGPRASRAVPPASRPARLAGATSRTCAGHGKREERIKQQILAAAAARQGRLPRRHRRPADTAR